MYQNCYVDVYDRKAYIWDDHAGLIEKHYHRYGYVLDPDGEFETMFGDRCRKVFRTSDINPADLYESDVSPVTRVLVDAYYDDDTPSVNHRILTYDIEVETTGGFPDPKFADNTITSIAGHNSATGCYTVFILDPDGLVSESSHSNTTIVPVDSEIILLRKFIDYWVGISPTIVTGWNTTYFDNPYLINRILKVLGQRKLDMLSPIGITKYMEYKGSWAIAGVSLLDYMQLYKKFNYNEASSYSLNAISNLELGRGKIEYDGDLNDLFRNDIQKFIEYNVVDVELVVELDRKLQFIDLARGIAHAGRVSYEDFIYSSKYLEGAILTYLKNKGLVACNKPADRQVQMKERGSAGSSFDGAYVKTPRGGVYEWVYDLDLTSLYPSIIMSLNISPETKIGKIESWDAKKFRNGDIDEWVVDGDLIKTEDLKSFMDEMKVSIASNGVMYRTDVVGCIPDILNTWFSRRVEYKDLMKKYGKSGDTEQYQFFHKRQLVQKILLNSLYGVLGLPVFRFFDLENALAVTATGQDIVKSTDKVANMKYNKEIGGNEDYVTYVDTDSVYLSSVPLLKHRYNTDDWNDDQWAKSTNDLASEMQAYINTFYDVFAKKMFNIDTHRFEIKKEYVSRRSLWLNAKKRYAQWIIMDNGVPVNKMDVKGMDVVRSSFPTAFKKIMNDVLEGIIIKDLPKDEIDALILDFKTKMRHTKPEDIARTSAVKNIQKYAVKGVNLDKVGVFKKGTPVHVKAAMAYNDLLRYYECSYDYPPISDGDKIKWVYLKKNPLELSQIAFRGEGDPQEILDYVQRYIDIEKIYDRELDNKLGSIYDALLWSRPTLKAAIASKFFTFS